MLNTNLNQFTVIENLDMFVPSAIEFLLEIEINTYIELQSEVLSSKIMSEEDIEKFSNMYQEVILNILEKPIGSKFSIEEFRFIPYYFTTKQAKKTLRYKQEDGWDIYEKEIEDLGPF